MINIGTEFDYLGGTVEVELRDRTAFVQFRRGTDTATIEESSGEVADWHRLYGKVWACLTGAALKSAEKKFAREYGEHAIGTWIIHAANELNED